MPEVSEIIRQIDGIEEIFRNEPSDIVRGKINDNFKYLNNWNGKIENYMMGYISNEIKEIKQSVTISSMLTLL